MPASSALHVAIDRFGLWYGGWLVLGGISSLSLGLWAWGYLGPGLGSLAGVAGLLLAFGLAWGELNRPSMVLRWDGQRWGWSTLNASGASPEMFGRLQVCLDFGFWMLLKLSPDHTAKRLIPVSMWLPVQRYGHERIWHGLRCAVYSPLPVGEASFAPQNLPDSGVAGRLEPLGDARKSPSA